MTELWREIPGSGYRAPRNDSDSVTAPCPRGSAKHALLAEHVPEPPGQIEPQRTAVIVERDGSMLDADHTLKLWMVSDTRPRASSPAAWSR
jgi:hypothetical protein